MMRHLTLLLMLIMSLTACTSVHKEVVGDSGRIQVASAAKEHGYFDLVARDSTGAVKWAEYDVPNALANEGEYAILDTMFRGNTAPTGYYLRLYNTTATPTLTSTLTTLSTYEPTTANGYDPAAQSITKDGTGWPLVPQLVSSHYEITSKTITITATGAISNLRWAALATTSNNTGKLMAYAQLAADRTLATGDSLQITYKVRLQ